MSKSLLKNYKKAKVMLKTKRTKETINKLHHIKEKVDEFQKLGYTHIILYKSSGTWKLAKRIFRNERWRSSGFSNNSNIYQTHYFGLLKLKFLIWVYERRLNKLEVEE